MKKMFNKAVLNGTTVMGDGLTYPRIPNVYTGDNEGGYQRGDMMDANAVVEMIKELTDTGEITIEELQNLINEEIQERVEGDQDQQRYTDQKIKDLIGTSPETLDTLKEIADALGEDPDFAANVWNKIAELTTKHNEDVQELQDAITSGFENIDFTPYVKKTDVVTDTTNGLMLASDKVKLDSLENYTLPIATDTTLGGIKTPARDVVNGTMPIDNVLRVNGSGLLELGIDFRYDKLTKKLVLEILNGLGHVRIKEIDCTDFIKDGMLESATVEVNPEGQEAGTYIKLVFNTDAGKDPVYINVSDLIHEYTAGDGIKLENGKFSLDTYPSDYTPKPNVFGDFGALYGVTFKIRNDTDGKLYNHIKLFNIAYNEKSNYPIKLGLISLYDYEKFKAKQNALTEIQLNNINNAITSISVNNIEQVTANGAVNLTIPNASITENGIMSKEDKAKLDSQPTIKASDASGVTDDDYVVIKKSEYQSILDRLSALENKA